MHAWQLFGTVICQHNHGLDFPQTGGVYHQLRDQLELALFRVRRSICLLNGNYLQIRHGVVLAREVTTDRGIFTMTNMVTMAVNSNTELTHIGRCILMRTIVETLSNRLTSMWLCCVWSFIFLLFLCTFESFNWYNHR